MHSLQHNPTHNGSTPDTQHGKHFKFKRTSDYNEITKTMCDAIAAEPIDAEFLDERLLQG